MKKFICILFISLMVTSSIVCIAEAKTNIETNEYTEKRLPQIYVDVDPILKELGYNYTTETVPEQLLIQILRSYELEGEQKTSEAHSTTLFLLMRHQNPEIS
jgi:hypothetical protein